MADEQDTNWEYKSGGETGPEESAEDSSAVKAEEIRWSAKEFIEHDRGAGWYVACILGSVLLAVVIYFITKDYFAAGATVIVGVIAAVHASNKPKELGYELTKKAIKVGEKSYGYGLFKSFSIAHEGAHTSIVLEPIKRFMPPMSIYFPPEAEKQITNLIGNYIPLQEHQPSVTDRLVHRLRF
jgi:hypothetical protein